MVVNPHFVNLDIHTHYIYSRQMPRITISHGEKVIEVELDEKTTGQVVEALRRHINVNLIDPETRTAYPGEVDAEKQITTLGKALLGKDAK